MPIPQNGQTNSNNSSANCLSVFDHFVKLALKGLTFNPFDLQLYYKMNSTKDILTTFVVVLRTLLVKIYGQFVLVSADLCFLNPLYANPTNLRTHSNNSSATADELFECIWPLCGVCAFWDFDRILTTFGVKIGQFAGDRAVFAQQIEWFWIQLYVNWVTEIYIHIKLLML